MSWKTRVSLDLDSPVSQDLVLPTELVDVNGVVICKADQQFCTFDVFLVNDQVDLKNNKITMVIQK